MNRFAAVFGSASVIALAAASAASAADITGRITEATGAIGLEGAIVTIVETGATATAGRDGSYRFRGLDAGEYTIEVNYLGTDVQTRTVVLESAAAIASANFALGANVAVTDNILVIGQRGQLTSALNRQRSADGVVTVLSADAIGRLPDENVAEAARRAVGVNVLNDQGEGRFVSIRGIDPNLSSTTINGVRLTSPEADSRQIPLDVIDSGILAGIVIQKSLTPDLDGDTIGGNIEIETLSGLDQTDRLLRLNVAGLYDDNVEDTGFRVSGVFADNFDDGKLGVALSISHQERNFGSDNIESDGPAGVEEDGLFIGEQLEFRDYVITRERTSIALNLDYQASPDTKFFLNTLWSDFSDQEFRSRVENTFEDPEFFGSDGNRAIFQGTPDDEYEVDRDIKDRLETQQIFTVAGGFEAFVAGFELDGTLSYAFAQEEEPDRIDTTFRQNFDSGLFAINLNDQIVPRLAFPDAAAEAAYFDASGYEFDDLEFLNGVAEDEEIALRLNARRDATIMGNPGFFQGGFAYRDRTKSFDAELEVYDGFDGDDLTLDQFENSVDFPLDTFGPAPDAGAVRSFFLSNRSSFELDALGSQEASIVEDYEFDEDVMAGYLMASADVGALRVVTGVRVEYTDFSANATQVFLQEEDAVVDGVTLTEDRIVTSPVSAANDYTDILPSLNLRYEASENVVLRAAYYASIGRPNAEQVAPRVFIEQNDENEIEAEFGNPDLDRQEANNIDLSAEWYINRDSVLSGGFFYKDITNFIAGVSVEDVVVNGVEIEDGSTFANLDDSTLWGIEINYQQALTMLPGLLDGVIVGANYTYVDSETSFEGRDIALPRQSENVWNAILGYDKGRLDLRLAATYRDEFIDDLNEGGDGVDRIVDDHLQVDFSAKVDVTENARAFLELKNIFDEPFVAVVRPNGFDVNSQYEEYGFSAVFGFQLQY